jgi:YD repeat-containing protein
MNRRAVNIAHHEPEQQRRAMRRDSLGQRVSAERTGVMSLAV